MVLCNVIKPGAEFTSANAERVREVLENIANEKFVGKKESEFYDFVRLTLAEIGWSHRSCHYGSLVTKKGKGKIVSIRIFRYDEARVTQLIHNLVQSQKRWELGGVLPDVADFTVEMLGRLVGDNRLLEMSLANLHLAIKPKKKEKDNIPKDD